MRRRMLASMAIGWATGAALAQAQGQLRPAAAPGRTTEVVLSLMPYSGTERRQFDAWVERFNAENPAFRARIVTTPPEAFKANLADRLAHEAEPADLYYWFAGTRLRELAARGVLAPLDDLWRARDLRSAFTPAMLDVVSWQRRPYALPLNYYQWGFYYRKSTFARLHLEPPADWAQMGTLARVARANGLAPTVLGLGDPWASAAWFDFFDLRLNGIEFHRSLTAGAVPFTDARVRAVFDAWKVVRDERWYLAEALPLAWREAAPYLLHDRAATFLMGNFFESSLPDGVRGDIGFFPFPRLRDGMPDYEEGPTDVLVQSARARNPAGATAFLAWTSRPEIQALLAAPYGKLATHRAVPLPQEPLAHAGGVLLRDAAGLAQFFDRDCGAELAAAGLRVFNAFVGGTLGVDAALGELEAARRSAPAAAG